MITARKENKKNKSNRGKEKFSSAHLKFSCMLSVKMQDRPLKITSLVCRNFLMP